MNHKIIFLLVFILVFPSLLPASSRKDKKGTKAEPPKKETPYQKLFKNKKYKTVKGLITLHKMDGKVYFEFPLNLLEKKMLVGSAVEGISNSGHGVVGEQALDPICIYFTQADSSIQIRNAGFVPVTEEENLKKAIDKNNVGAILSSFKISAVSPDSSAVVFDATPFFVNGNANMDPFSPATGLYSRKTSYKNERSLLYDVMAYTDNITVSSYLSFEVTSYFFGFMYEENRPSTALMKRSLMLLPEEEMRPRINDPRIGIFYNRHLKFSGDDNGIKPVYYANRWKLEPKDPEAFNRGELTEPQKPITFYVDDQFPPQWVKYIREGAEKWNRAFEKIGFKNAIVTQMYPENDPEFDPNNIKYSCIKYAPTSTQNSMGPSWADPRTGEILSASVYLYHGVIDLLSDWLFIQTSVADKRVRTVNIPDEIVGEGLSYIIAHEVGHCLGLMHNMGASFAFPVDSLRSPSFTQKYGTTPSIMDYARFNFIAREGDLERGVRLLPPDIGVYDYYVIKWLYSPIPDAKTPQEEVPVLRKWIAEKIKDPMYRYGRQQIYTNFDPGSQTEDLGNDQVKATNYAFRNLKYILNNLNTWTKDEDPDFSFRKKMAFSVINIQFYWYLTHVLTNIGGVYQYEKYEGDPEIGENVGEIYGQADEYLRSVLFPYMMRKVANIGFSQAKSYETPYSQTECIKDVFDYVWGSTVAGKEPSKEKLSMQKSLVKLLIDNSKVNGPVAGGNVMSLADLTETQKGLLNMIRLRQQEESRFEGNSSFLSLVSMYDPCQGEVNGFGFLERFVYQTPDITHIYYGWLLQCKEIIKKATNVQKGTIKQEYQYLLLQINKALKVD